MRFYDTPKNNISVHLKNIFDEVELQKDYLDILNKEIEEIDKN